MASVSKFITCCLVNAFLMIGAVETASIAGDGKPAETSFSLLTYKIIKCAYNLSERKNNNQENIESDSIDIPPELLI